MSGLKIQGEKMKAILLAVVIATASVGMAKGKSAEHRKDAAHSKASAHRKNGSAQGECKGLKGKARSRCMKAHKASNQEESSMGTQQ